MAPYLALDARCAAMLALLQKLARIGLPIRAAHSELHTQSRTLDRAQGRAFCTAARWLRGVWQSAAWRDPPAPAVQ